MSDDAQRAELRKSIEELHLEVKQMRTELAARGALPI
jgi:hypothetical protein